MDSKVQALFGGAFSANLPLDCNDMSEIRQIPDNQEVFAHPQTDQSIIIELLEAVDPHEPDEQALKTHFEDLAQTNGAAQDCRILHAEQVEKDKINMAEADSCWYVVGEQQISKFNESAKNTVEIHMGLIRVHRFSTDILLTFNNPTSIDLTSSSHNAVPTSVVRWNVDNFRNVLTTLTLNDAGIFGV